MNSLFENEVPAGFKPPRPFQAQAMKNIAEGILAGHKNQMLMAPTGGGKTYLGLRIAHKALKQGKRATFLCDRITLIDQTSARADEYGLTDHGVIQGDHHRQDWSKPLQIASVQTIESRGWPKTDVLIVDEAHTMRETWVKKAEEEGVRVIGLSATPFSRGLGKIFTNLVAPATMHELTLEGILVPMRVLSCQKPDMDGAKVDNFGEWQQGEAGARGMEIIGDVVSEWLRHAEGRKTIVFGATIAHCEELCRHFNEAGVLAATFTQDTTPPVRKGLVKEFSKPDSVVRVLISVEALAKGFDVQDVGCVVDCRPLRKSLSTAIQMWGRGLRSSPETGKTDCLLLDHSGNITRFAEDFTTIYFDGLASLDKGEALDKAIRPEGKDERERTGCPKCSYKPFRQRCMSCGFEIVAQSLIGHEAGAMKEVVLNKKKLADDKLHLWRQLCTFARNTDWVKSKSGYPYMQFKEITGSPPPSSWHADSAPVVPVSAELAKRLKGKRQSLHIAAAAARKKQAVAA
ncbi:helicase [Variovorax sp. WS11]|uniref:DEAD/DEAH box helicase n=1 Tax=Variovorax sp. WS11 TaxID=1105204 RepID=UPI000D0D26C3|nr:DEAD/DEAH box helicase family protein [Variovorax sp. WS11]NDZ12065.1 DEAD/DEAH box helicase family protein [Variovorax sp. WS11]PSL83754.1 helicase [Variovorax sp. WS11]